MLWICRQAKKQKSHFSGIHVLYWPSVIQLLEWGGMGKDIEDLGSLH